MCLTLLNFTTRLSPTPIVQKVWRLSNICGRAFSLRFSNSSISGASGSLGGSLCFYTSVSVFTILTSLVAGTCFDFCNSRSTSLTKFPNESGSSTAYSFASARDYSIYPSVFSNWTFLNLAFTCEGLTSRHYSL